MAEVVTDAVHALDCDFISTGTAVSARRGLEESTAAQINAGRTRSYWR